MAFFNPSILVHGSCDLVVSMFHEGTKLLVLWNAWLLWPNNRDKHWANSIFIALRLISRAWLLCASSYNVSEKAGSVSVTVQRTGNLNQYAIVLCRTEQGTASSSSRVSSRPGQQDYVEYAGQVGMEGPRSSAWLQPLVHQQPSQEIVLYSSSIVLYSVVWLTYTEVPTSA